MTRTLELIVSPTGEVEITTHGYRGSSCRQASRFLEEALGKAVSDRLMADFYQAAIPTNVQQQTQP